MSKKMLTALRYLSVSLGRPMAIHDSDITIPLPSEPPESILPRVGKQEGKVILGVVAHARYAASLVLYDTRGTRLT